MTTSNNNELKPDYGDMVKGNLNRLKAIARSYSDTNESREDLLQEMLYQLWRGLPSFKANSQLDTWVYRVALNTAITHVRTQKTKPKLLTGIDFDWESSAYDDDANNSIDILEQFLLSLNKIDKAIMMLYLDDISHKQISDITGLSINVIGVRISRMKQKFKQQLGD